MPCSRACDCLLACLLSLFSLGTPGAAAAPPSSLSRAPSFPNPFGNKGEGNGTGGGGVTPSLPPPFPLVSSARLTSHTIPDLNIKKKKTRHTVSFVLGGAASGDRPPATPRWGSAPQPTAGAAAATTLSNNFFISHCFSPSSSSLSTVPFTLGPSILQPPSPIHTPRKACGWRSGVGRIWTGRFRLRARTPGRPRCWCRTPWRARSPVFSGVCVWVFELCVWRHTWIEPPVHQPIGRNHVFIQYAR